MKTATLGLAAVVLASFLASNAMAQHGNVGRYGSRGGHVGSVSHHGRVGHPGHHGSYHGNYHSSRHRPVHTYDHHRYDRYHGYHGHYGYRAPVIVAPPACIRPPAHSIYQPNYHPFNSFYYGGKSFSVGVRF